MRGYDIKLAPASLGHRAAYMHALTAGQVAEEYEPRGKAAEEIAHLYRWLRKKVHL